MSILKRFTSKISQPDENGCINWTGAKSNGYGKITVGSKANNSKRAESAHRISYELFIGKIPKNKCVLHKCDNTFCVNPKHLFLGTQKENMLDMINKGRDFKRPLLGSKHGNAKLTEEKVREIKIKLKHGISAKELAKIYNVTAINIRYIARGKGWKHVDRINLTEGKGNADIKF